MKTTLSSQAQRRTKEKLFHKRSGRLRVLDRIDRIYRILSIDKLCYKGIGSAMAVHRHFGTGYLEELHKNALMVELEALGLHIFTLRFEIRNNLKTGKNNFEEVRGQLARAFSISYISGGVILFR